MNPNKEDTTIVLLTGLGVNYRFLAPYKIIAEHRGWKCEIVKNSAFTTNTLFHYSRELKRVLDKCDRAVLIGFSLGGVASAFTIADSEKYRDKVLKAYTVCSPVDGVSDWLYYNKVLNFLIDIPVPDWTIGRDLSSLRNLLQSFRSHVAKRKINNQKEKLKDKVLSLFHKNDMISPVDRSSIEGLDSREIKYDYPFLPKLLHHHAACGDPRVFLDILEEIESKV